MLRFLHYKINYTVLYLVMYYVVGVREREAGGRGGGMSEQSPTLLHGQGTPNIENRPILNSSKNISDQNLVHRKTP